MLHPPSSSHASQLHEASELGHGAMNVLLTGINHKTAPVEMRKLLAIEPGRLTDATRVLLSVPGVEEAMILSTCNRVEVLASHRANCPDLLGFLGVHSKKISRGAFRQHADRLGGGGTAAGFM
jgi:glutamyl-tRNA reductase